MKFCPSLAEKTKPLRDLLKKEKAWVWGPAQQEAFKRLRIEMASENVLALYDPEKETTVSSDASSFGLSAVLMQKQPSGELRPVAYASMSKRLWIYESHIFELRREYESDLRSNEHYLSNSEKKA